MLVIPLDLDATSPALLQVDLAANEWQTLIDPKLGSISIANNDWQVSPDGEKLVFLDSSSRALWLLELP